MSELCQNDGQRHLVPAHSLAALFIGLLWQVAMLPTVSFSDETVETGDQYCMYSYEDGFSDERVRDDSHQQSLFWVQGAAPPDEPTLVFVDFTEDNPMLLLRGGENGVAQLGYHLPVTPDVVLPAIPLSVEVLLEVQLLTSPNPNRPTLGYLAYQTSADGKKWDSPPRALKSGANHISPGLLAHNRYIRFQGHQAVIDNLRIRIYREPGTWHVPQDFTTIQQAVNAAATGDTIVLAPGHYRGVGNYDIDFHGKDLQLVGDGAPEDCVIDCESQGRGFVFTQGESPQAVVSNITIMRGYARQGGGVYLSQSSPTLANCHIRECVCESTTTDQAQGGGIYCQGGQPEIRDCWILNNRVFGEGAGSQGAGLYAERSALRVENCVISENAAEEGSADTFGGGGLYLVGPTPESQWPPVLQGNLIVGNTAAGFGAGLQIRESAVDVVNCTVVGNQCDNTGNGGGIYFRGDLAGSLLRVNSSILWGNQTGEQWNQIAMEGAAGANVRYCQVQGGWPGWENSDAEPVFVNTGAGDYHLQSQAGRWSSREQIWVFDGVNCPCLDTGDPNLAYAAEYSPTGNRINRGAFGGRAQASKGAGPRVFHVDAAHGDDGNIGIRRTLPLATIQMAVDQSTHGDAVLVWPGVYEEDVILWGKKIRVQSAADAATVVAPPLGYAFSFYKAEGPETILKNFVISNRPGAIAGIYCLVAQPTLENLTVTDCSFGIAAEDCGDLVVSNCVLWGNYEGDLKGCRAEYSCVEHTQYGQAEGIGNIVRNPRFVDPNDWDYHLQSKFGRYWPEHEVWVVDSYHSPAIDRGDPERYPVEETPYNGGRLNMGAYGGSGYASRSAPFADPDLNQDGIVDFFDFAILAEKWLSEPH